MTDPFRNQRYSSHLSPIKQEPDEPISPLGSGQASSYYNRSYSTEPDILNRNTLGAHQFRSANNLQTHHSQAPMPLSTSTSIGDIQAGNKQFQPASSYMNKELVKQLRSNIELLFKGTKIFSHFALYPLKALRWQCQINSESAKIHLTPITLMPVFYNLNYHGYITLCKGCFSMAAYNGIKMITESVLGEVTSFEKNIEDVNQPHKLYGHIALKFIASALTTPIFSAVIYESVQSGIINENIGLTDLLRETWNRITGYKYNYRTRLIPIWSLVLPTSVYFVGSHFLSIGINRFLTKSMSVLREVFKEKRYKIDETEQEVVEEPYFSALIDLASQLGSLIALYPVETIINRLIVQGTRTIIDNTDTGCGVIPINTRYDGFLDCFQTIQQTEGVLGLYKGLGTVVIECILCYGLLNLAKTIATRIYDAEWTTRSDSSNFKNFMSNTTNEIQQNVLTSIDLLKNN